MRITFLPATLYVYGSMLDQRLRQAVHHTHHFSRRLIPLLQFHYVDRFRIEGDTRDLRLDRLRLGQQLGVQLLAGLRVRGLLPHLRRHVTQEL